MATSPSEPGARQAELPGAARIEILAGGPATAEELAAVIAALSVEERLDDPVPRTGRWRWSGRRWGAAPVWGRREG